MFEGSAKELREKLGYTGRRISAHIVILMALRCGRVKGQDSEI